MMLEWSSLQELKTINIYIANVRTPCIYKAYSNRPERTSNNKIMVGKINSPLLSIHSSS
jgi:hypothetical protein